MRNACLLAVILLCSFGALAQSFELINGKRRTQIPFVLVRNMVVVKLNINNKGPFNFILDTGVGIMLITEPKLADEINLSSKKVIKVYGLNGDSYEAWLTPQLKVDLPNLESRDVSAAILTDERFNLSNYAGMHIHGLLGHDFFSQLTVRLDFYDSTLVAAKPMYAKRLRKGIKVPLIIEEKKPYINTDITTVDGKTNSRKLLIDLGAGFPLSLENVVEESGLPENFISANLGVGLTGPIDGYISRVKDIRLGNYHVKDPITAIPDQESLKRNVPMVPRDGVIGVGVLRRFDVTLDYSTNSMYVKRGINFGDPFEHDMTGMEYYFEGQDFSKLVIGRVEPGSAADAIGLQPKDEISLINIKEVTAMPVDRIDQLFRSKEGRNILLDIHRGDEYFKVVLTLRRRI